MRTLLLPFIFLIAFTSTSHAHAQEEDQSCKPPIRTAIAYIKNQITAKNLITVGAGTTVLGAASAGSGTLIRVFATGLIKFRFFDSFTSSLVAAGGSLTGIGTILIIAGVAVAVFEPRTLAAGTISDYYLTAEGFQEYLQLPEDQMEMFANMNPQLAQLVFTIEKSMVLTAQSHH